MGDEVENDAILTKEKGELDVDAREIEYDVSKLVMPPRSKIGGILLLFCLSFFVFLSSSKICSFGYNFQMVSTRGLIFQKSRVEK